MPGYGIADANSGKGLLPWSWATKILSTAHNYFLSTVRSGGSPHVMPIWGIWLGDKFYFSTGKKSVKARNLAANPKCVLCPENAGEAVILEGVARKSRNAAILKKFARAYLAKYDWDISTMNEPVYVIHPRVVFGLIEKGDNFTKTATRWKFR